MKMVSHGTSLAENRHVRFAIYVRANARIPVVGGSYSGCLLVKVGPPPSEGAANAAVIEALSQVFEVPKRSVQIRQGRRSHRKLIDIDIGQERGEALLRQLAQNPRS